AGPAQLVQIGNTAYDLDALRIAGPLRPRLTLGPVQRNADAGAVMNAGARTTLKSSTADALGGGFLRWYLWATLVLVGISIAGTALVGGVRVHLLLRRIARSTGERAAVTALGHGTTSRYYASAVVALSVTLLAWGGAGALA